MKALTKDEIQVRIARNVAALIDRDESCSAINLGVGIPTLVTDYLTRENVYVMAENGILGVGPAAYGDDVHPDLINAGRQPVLETKGCSYFDSAMSFGMIRGGRLDVTVLGAFEVDQEGDVANWIIPGGKKLGVGGAMDLVSGARRVIIAMTHTSKNGPKLVKKCSLPLTARGRVDTVVTEYGVFAFRDGRIVLEQMAPDITDEELRGITPADYIRADCVEPMAI